MPPLASQDRVASIAQVVADPPNVHDGAPGGVWGTSPACYEFIANTLPHDAVSLETGLGMSTVMFSLWSRRHVCVVGSSGQVDSLKRHCAARGIPVTHVEFAVGTSDVVLPTLELEPVDLFLIDGGHGFPAPVIDWYYGSLWLRAGGVVVVDDIQLPSVHDFLIRFLEKDPRWSRVAGDHKWVAYRKDGDFSIREEWTDQAFLGPRRLPTGTRIKSAVHRGLAPVRAASRTLADRARR